MELTIDRQENVEELLPRKLKVQIARDFLFPDYKDIYAVKNEFHIDDQSATFSKCPKFDFFEILGLFWVHGINEVQNGQDGMDLGTYGT